MTLAVKICASLSAISANAWDSLVDTKKQPFLSHACLSWFEQSGAVGPGTGWEPTHRIVEHADGTLLAAAPAYLKDHSYGEFVFDFAWANAAAHGGINYYPKLVSCVPFTPVPGPRLLGRDPNALRVLRDSLIGACAAGEASSAHLLFERSDYAIKHDPRWLPRTDVRYLWRNAGFASFEAFLEQLNSKRRKEIRRERRRVAEQGLQCTMRDAESLSDQEWGAVEACYARTYAIRGQHAYLPRGFWRGLAERLPGVLKIACVTHPDHTGDDHAWPLLAAALFLRGQDALYGRHWGTLADIDCLHFETCYYQGIDYCIAEGIPTFDAGVQGEQKLRRGFEPVISQSQHYIEHPGLRAAVAAALSQESASIANIRDLHAQHTAFKQSDQ